MGNLLCFVPLVYDGVTTAQVACFLKAHDKPVNAEAYWDKDVLGSADTHNLKKTTGISQWLTKGNSCAYRSFNTKIYATSKSCKTFL